jgi:signal transduction histidine kinase
VSSWSEQAGFKGIPCSFADQRLPAALADRNQLHQAFINLLVNAIEATAPAVPSSAPAATRSQGDPRRHLRLRCGSPKDVQEKIFDPFFTTKDSGTGLGLAITHGIIEQHDGRIDVDSAPGQGTTFMIILPATGHTP